jgi:hypothetical protein
MTYKYAPGQTVQIVNGPQKGIVYTLYPEYLQEQSELPGYLDPQGRWYHEAEVIPYKWLDHPLYTYCREDARLYTIFLLTADRAIPEEQEYTSKDTTSSIYTAIKTMMQEVYGADVECIPPSQFQREVMQRTLHSPHILSLLAKLPDPTTQYYVYAAYRTTSGLSIPGAQYIPVHDKDALGREIYAYIVVGAPLIKEFIEKNELTFVSRPAPAPEENL